MPPSKAILPPSKAILPAESKTRSRKAENARKQVADNSTVKEESDEEEESDDEAEWQWLYEKDNSEEVASPSQTNAKGGGSAATKRTRRLSKGTENRRIIGAKAGNTICKIADCVLINNDTSNTNWVGVISGFEEDEGYDENAESYLDIMKANIWWFSSPKDIHSKTRKRSDFLEVSIPILIPCFLWLMCYRMSFTYPLIPIQFLWRLLMVLLRSYPKKPSKPNTQREKYLEIEKKMGKHSYVVEDYTANLSHIQMNSYGRMCIIILKKVLSD